MTSGEVTFDFPAVMRRKEQVVKQLVTGVEAAMKSYSVEVIRAFL